MKTTNVRPILHAAILVGNDVDNLCRHLADAATAIAQLAYDSGMLNAELARGWMVTAQGNDWTLTLDGQAVIQGHFYDDSNPAYNPETEAEPDPWQRWVDDDSGPALAQLARDLSDDAFLDALIKQDE